MPVFKSPYLRLCLAALGFVSVLFFPPWMTVVLMVLLSFWYRAWEVLCIGLLADFLWLPAGSLFSPFPLFTFVAIALVWGFEPIRSEFLLRR